MNNPIEFKERLKSLRAAAHLSQEKMAKSLNISRGLYNGLETGREKPSDWIVQQVSMVDKLGVQILDDRPPLSEPPMSAEEHEILLSHRAPIISWAQAGELISLQDLPTILAEPRRALFTDCSDSTAFGIEVDGDSMLPDFRSGDIVFVMPSHRPRNHSVVVAKLKNDGIVLKVFNMVGRDGKAFRLTSLNPVYQPTDYTEEDFHWIYPVHSSRRLHWR